MDAVTKYRKIVEQVLHEFGAIPSSDPKIQKQTIVDREKDHYLILDVGWNGQRIHDCLIHLDIINGKVWVQCDNTNWVIANELADAGIPREDIVLGLRKPELRQFTDFGVA